MRLICPIKYIWNVAGMISPKKVLKPLKVSCMTHR